MKIMHQFFQHRLAVRRELAAPTWRRQSGLVTPAGLAQPDWWCTGPPVHHFHASAVLGEVVQFNLSDIGEGIKEVTVKVGELYINWDVA
jgi:hypothetical protein